MKYTKTIELKDGRNCIIKTAGKDVAKEVLSVFIQTHAETDYLLTYPDENSFTLEDEEAFLDKAANHEREVELCAVVDGKIVGTAGVELVDDKEKERHRCYFGISILKNWWGLGIGLGLIEACIDCAKKAGYEQMELEVVADNKPAMALYKKVGFSEFGRNPKGFKSRLTGWQELILMRLELAA